MKIKSTGCTDEVDECSLISRLRGTIIIILQLCTHCPCIVETHDDS